MDGGLDGLTLFLVIVGAIHSTMVFFRFIEWLDTPKPEKGA